MVPEAPPRFSTTTGWPSIGLILSANSRATASTPPPGGKLTTRRMLREGKPSWANAGAAAPSAIPPSNLSAMRRFMFTLLARRHALEGELLHAGGGLRQVDVALGIGCDVVAGTQDAGRLYRADDGQ